MSDPFVDEIVALLGRYLLDGLYSDGEHRSLFDVSRLGQRVHRKAGKKGGARCLIKVCWVMRGVRVLQRVYFWVSQHERRVEHWAVVLGVPFAAPLHKRGVDRGVG